MQTLLILAILAIISGITVYNIVPKKFKFGPIQTKWLKSLEQNPERQLKGYLGIKFDYDDYKCCCLGELGLIAGICEWRNNDLYVNSSRSNSSSYLYAVHEKVGLFSPQGDSKDRELKGLARMNDDGVTWPDIAAHVRKYPEQYFTKSV